MTLRDEFGQQAMAFIDQVVAIHRTYGMGEPSQAVRERAAARVAEVAREFTNQRKDAEYVELTGRLPLDHPARPAKSTISVNVSGSVVSEQELTKAIRDALKPRATGGTVDPGSTYLVGESGPETFTTGSTGAAVTPPDDDDDGLAGVRVPA